MTMTSTTDRVNEPSFNQKTKPPNHFIYKTIEGP